MALILLKFISIFSFIPNLPKKLLKWSAVYGFDNQLEAQMVNR